MSGTTVDPAATARDREPIAPGRSSALQSPVCTPVRLARETVRVSESRLFHLLPLTSYREAGEPPITGKSLAEEGFVHCSPDEATTRAVANSHYFEADEQMVLLELDPAELSAPVRWEASAPSPPDGVSPDTLFPHVYGPIDRAAISDVLFARRDVNGRYVGFERRGDTANRLDLLPHPEGGWYRRNWTSGTTVPVQGRGERPTATAIHFLLPAGERSEWHTVASDEVWFWHGGGPLTLDLGGEGERPSSTPRSRRLGGDLSAGEIPQLCVPAGTWQRAAASADSETLVSCVVSPGFDFADFAVL